MSSIAGVRDLGILVDENYYFGNFKIIERQIGADRGKLRLNSPQLQSADFNIPVLLIHGLLDAIVPLKHDNEMDSALSPARKPHRLVMIAEADHSMTGESVRNTLPREVEAFLH